MIKVFFCCSWDSDIENFLKTKYLPLTPNESGKFKNIEAVTDIKNAEWVVIIDDIHNNYLNEILNFDKSKIICIPREPGNITPKYKKFDFKYDYTYDNFFHCWSSIMAIEKNYDELLNFKLPLKTKLCSSITSGFNGGSGLYIKRIDMIKKISKEKKFIDKIDLYGYNWSKDELGEMYKGVFGGFNTGTCKKIENLIPNTTKWDGLDKYSYSIAIENCIKKNYFSEKFTDCILSWTIPIYIGCPNIGDFFPKDCYYVLDIDSPNIIEEIDNILKKPITKRNIVALGVARRLILDKYNVWNMVNEIILNDK
tara:strand:- start:5463 stop:6392 length:930 start_codon:yes stop_codon:yes gene_type:complete